MYTSYWNLREKPFENTLDSRFLFNTQQHQEALSRLIYVVKENKGVGLLSAPHGCGKSLLAQILTQTLGKEHHQIAWISNPHLDDLEMLRMILHQLGENSPPERKADILIQLEKTLRANRIKGKKNVLLIDEAHAIAQPSIFNELCSLLNFQADNQFLLSLLILGQTELNQKIKASPQLEQSIAMRCQMQPFSAEETANYILHRLVMAGAKGPLFTEATLQFIHDRAQGIPRQINQICDLSLLVGMARQSKQITQEIVEEAIRTID